MELLDIGLRIKLATDMEGCECQAGGLMGRTRPISGHFKGYFGGIHLGAFVLVPRAAKRIVGCLGLFVHPQGEMHLLLNPSPSPTLNQFQGNCQCLHFSPNNRTKSQWCCKKSWFPPFVLLPLTSRIACVILFWRYKTISCKAIVNVCISLQITGPSRNGVARNLGFRLLCCYLSRQELHA